MFVQTVLPFTARYSSSQNINSNRGEIEIICDKCSEIVRLTEKVLELETRIQTLVEDSKNVRAVLLWM